MPTNPLDDRDETRQQHIRERAYHLWEADGRPVGRSEEYWDRARALIGMEENPEAGQVPVHGEVPEEASIQQNLGEFPDRFSDQGDRQETPSKELRKQG